MCVPENGDDLDDLKILHSFVKVACNVNDSWLKGTKYDLKNNLTRIQPAKAVHCLNFQKWREKLHALRECHS